MNYHLGYQLTACPAMVRLMFEISNMLKGSIYVNKQEGTL
jgi:hypothetical protein